MFEVVSCHLPRDLLECFAVNRPRCAIEQRAQWRSRPSREIRFCITQGRKEIERHPASQIVTHGIIRPIAAEDNEFIVRFAAGRFLQPCDGLVTVGIRATIGSGFTRWSASTARRFSLFSNPRNSIEISIVSSRPSGRGSPSQKSSSLSLRMESGIAGSRISRSAKSRLSYQPCFHRGKRRAARSFTSSALKFRKFRIVILLICITSVASHARPVSSFTSWLSEPLLDSLFEPSGKPTTGLVFQCRRPFRVHEIRKAVHVVSDVIPFRRRAGH